jgi:hypothetical protein
MKKSTAVHKSKPQGTRIHTTVAEPDADSVTSTGTTVDQPTGHAVPRRGASVGQKTCSEASRVASKKSARVARGLAAAVSTKTLKTGIWTRALLVANRFRVIRTIDIAVCCFAERPYKAALTAAQRAMRGLVKANLLRRYRTDRFQTVYGLTQGGVDWLAEAGFEASSSVRRVSDMTNPEHRLWAQFWTLACEARGLQARTEQELLQHLNRNTKPGQALIQGLLSVQIQQANKSRSMLLRPDAIAMEVDGTTWLEVDRSKRGADREASLRALVSSVGKTLKDGSSLRRVIVFCKTERIRLRALAVLEGLAKGNNTEVLVSGRRHFKERTSGIYEVWGAQESHLADGRSELVDVLLGHVIIQLLPIWLPKVRVDATNSHSLAGWFDENYLPYARPGTDLPWSRPTSPLLQPF